MLTYNQLTLDWLSWSYDTDEYSTTKINKFFSVFPELHIKEMYSKQVYSHYEKAFYLTEDIFIYYDTEDGQNKGVNVSCPSHGLEWLFKTFKVNSVSEMLKLILDRGGKISRLDFAFDDFSKTFYPLQYFVWWQNGQFKSKFRVAHFDHGADGGTTFALGNRAGLKYLRIYDKNIESQGQINAIRYEFEFHSYTATAIAEAIVGEKQFTFIDFITSMFKIIENTGKSKKCRENLLQDWFNWVVNLKFNDEISKIPTGLQGKTLEKSIVWFETYCTKTLSKMFFIFGKDYVIDIGNKAFSRLSPIEIEKLLSVKEYKYKEK